MQGAITRTPAAKKEETVAEASSPIEANSDMTCVVCNSEPCIC